MLHRVPVLNQSVSSALKMHDRPAHAFRGPVRIGKLRNGKAGGHILVEGQTHLAPMFMLIWPTRIIIAALASLPSPDLRHNSGKSYTNGGFSANLESGGPIADRRRLIGKFWVRKNSLNRLRSHESQHWHKIYLPLRHRPPSQGRDASRHARRRQRPARAFGY